MKKSLIALAVLPLLAPTPDAHAQARTQAPVLNWAGVWLGGYYDTDPVNDGADRWDFGSSLAGGVTLHRQISAGLALGLDASFSPMDYEVRREDALGELQLVDEGSGQIVTGFATARLRYGGGAELSIYLTGGAGAFMYRLTDSERNDTDLGLLTGAGIEYRVSPRMPLFVEWGRYWVFHQEDGVEENTAHHSHLRVGIRRGF